MQLQKGAPMNYKQIVQFLTICKYMNLSAAARELFISQPALSLSLSRMEEHLDVRLFHRDGNRLILTTEGERLKENFQKLNDDFEELFRNSSNLSRQTPDVIKIAFASPVTLYMAVCLSPSLSSYKGKPIQKMHMNFSQCAGMLKNGQIDFAVTTPPLEDPAVNNNTVYTEEFYFVVSSRHKLAQKKKVSFKDLEKVEFVGLSRQHKSRREIDRLCLENKFVPNYVIECEYEELNQIIRENAGSSRYAGFCTATAHEIEYGEGYVIIPVNATNMHRSYSISWLAESKLQYAYKGLLDQIQEQFPEYVRQQMWVLQKF